RDALGHLPLSRELATIRTDVALPVGPRDLGLRERDVEALRELYTRYGFNQALRELEGGSAVDAAEKEPARARGGARYAAPAGGDAPALDPALSAPGEYETILDVPRLETWIAELRRAGRFALDTETDSLDPMRARLVGISFAAQPRRAAYLPLGHDYPGAPSQLDHDTALEMLRPLLEDPQVAKIGQHGKYDLHVFRRHGIAVRGYADDTLLESFVLNSSQRHDMDSLARRLLGYETLPYEAVAGKGARQIPFNAVAVDDATRYAAEDADITLRLHHALSPRLAEAPGLQKVYREIEMPLVEVLARIEANGVMVDADELRRQTADLSRRMLAAQNQAPALAGRRFHLESPKPPPAAQLQPRFAQAAAGAAVRRARAAGAGEDAQGPAQHQRGGAGGHRRPARTAARDPRVPRPGQAAQHLHREVAGDGQSRHRPGAHQLPPGRRRHRPPGLERPEPAEHPDPHRRRPPHPQGLRGAGGASPGG